MMGGRIILKGNHKVVVLSLKAKKYFQKKRNNGTPREPSLMDGRGRFFGEWLRVGCDDIA